MSKINLPAWMQGDKIDLAFHDGMKKKISVAEYKGSSLLTDRLKIRLCNVIDNRLFKFSNQRNRLEFV